MFEIEREWRQFLPTENVNTFWGFCLCIYLSLCFPVKNNLSLNSTNFFLTSESPLQFPVLKESILLVRVLWLIRREVEVREDTISFKCAWWKLTSRHPLGWAYDINFTLGTKIKSFCQCHCCVYSNISEDLNIALLQLAWGQALFFCAWFHTAGICPISKRMCRKEHDF